MTTRSEPAVLLDVKDGVGWIALNRPEAYNAFNLDLAEGLLDVVIRCDEDDNVRARHCRQRAFVLRRRRHPDGDVYQDTDRQPARNDRDSGSHEQTSRHGGPRGRGGHRIQSALAGDLVLAADTARFTVAYTAIGLAPDGSSTFTLPRLIGAKRALELIQSNRMLSPDEARELGLVNQAFPATQFVEQVREYTVRLAQGPTAALGHAKRLLTLSTQSTLETQMEHERRAIAATARTADNREGADAFFAKRPAKFNGR